MYLGKICFYFLNNSLFVRKVFFIEYEYDLYVYV